MGGVHMRDENEDGTGWPGAPTEPLPVSGSSAPHHTVQLRTADGRRGDDDFEPGARVQRRGFFGRWFGRMAVLALAAAALVVVLLVTNLVGFWHFSNPFASR